MAKTNNFSTKEKIINTAEELVASKGTNNFSLRDISKKANISLGTLYYYYKTKEEIITDILVRHLKTLDEDYFDWLYRHKNDLKPERFFDVIFYKGVKLYNRAKIHIFLLNQCIGGNTKLLELFKSLYKTWEENIKIGTRQVFPNNKNADEFSSLIMLVIDGLIVREVLGIETNIEDKKLKQILEDLAV